MPLLIQMPTRQSGAALRDAGQPSIVPSLLPSSKSALVDEFGDLDAQIAGLKPKISRHSDLRETILGWHEDLAGDQDVTEKGERWDVLITPRDKRRVITMAGKSKLKKLWGVGKFLELCSIALKNLPDPKDAGNVYSISERTGPRHLRAVPLLKLAA